MVCIQIRAVHQDPVGAVVQVGDLLGEPRDAVHVSCHREREAAVLVVGGSSEGGWRYCAPGRPPSSSRQELSWGSMSTMFTRLWSSWMISFSCSWLLSQSTNISNSELRRLDFLDSMCTRLTWFSYSKYWHFVTC